MANIMYRFSQLTRRERISVCFLSNSFLLTCFILLAMADHLQLRNKVERLSNYLSWDSLGKYYIKARNEAVRRAYGMSMSEAEFWEDHHDRENDHW